MTARRELARDISDAASSIAPVEVDSQAEPNVPDFNPGGIENFTETLMMKLDDVEDCRSVAGSWVVKVGNHKYTSSLRHDIHELITKATLKYSGFEGYLTEDVMQNLSITSMALRER